MTPPPPAVVAIGGGHGLSRALAALTSLSLRPTAVVTVADDGGSSGRLRADLGIVALGDLRMALLALAESADLVTVLAHRFERGDLEGHALGNLLLLALAEIEGGDIVAALDAAGRLLDCAGRVLPSTTSPVQLRARVDGSEVGGQARLTRTRGPIESIWLDPVDPPVCAEAAAAVAQADLVVLGPGSLFTSVIVNLLVPGLRDALIATRGLIVYVANIATQAGETEDLDAAAHLQALHDHVPGLRLDAVVCHAGPPPADRAAALAGTLPAALAGRVVLADVAWRDAGGAVHAAHDPGRLAAALATLLPASGTR